MAVDPMMLTPMLDPFRGMLAECETAGMSGEHVDAMRAALARLEELGADCADIGEFNAKITTENLFLHFSDAYGKALAAGADAQSKAGAAGDDEAMLAGMLDGLRQARAQSDQVPDSEGYLASLEQAIALGESGIPFPVFLRRLEEEGLSAAMEGSGMTRAGIVKEARFAAEAHDPLALEAAAAKLAAFDSLAAATRFGAPDNLLYTLAADRVDWEFAPRKAEWAWTHDRWHRILDNVVDWLDSFAAFAPSDSRWRTPGASEAQVRRNIERDQQCLPGEVAVRLEILAENHGLDFDGIFTHPTYLNEQAAARLYWSEERLDLLRRTLPLMAPGAEPPQELVAETEALHKADGAANPRRGERVSLPLPVGIE